MKTRAEPRWLTRALSKTRLSSPILRNIVPFVPLLIVWQVVVELGIWPPSFVPPVGVIPVAAANLITKSELLQQVGLTLIRVVVAASIGLTVGVVVGVFIATNRRLHLTLSGLIDFLQSIGEIGWLPLFVIWSGFNDRTIVLTIGYTVFFPVFYGTVSGFSRIPQQLVDSVKTLGGSKKDVVIEVMLPGSLPSIITGFRTGVGFGWRTVILAEMLIAQRGLGVVLFEARQFFRIDWVIVGMIVAGVIWLAMDQLLLSKLEEQTIERWGLSTAKG